MINKIVLTFSICLFTTLLISGEKITWKRGPGTVNSVASKGDSFVYPFYSSGYLFPQTTSKKQLQHFLSSHHDEYHLDGWFFFGNLLNGKKGNEPSQVNDFFIAVQRIDIEPIPGVPIMVAIFPSVIGFNNATLNRYIFGGAVALESQVIVTSDPWSVVVICSEDEDGYPSTLSMTLVKGKMGEKGAEYHLASDVVDQDLQRLQVDVWIKDDMGIVNEGYGPSSFFPQWILSDQREIITSTYDGSVKDYLEATNNPMTGQGSFYYSAPLLTVQQFKVTRDYTETLAEGTRGSLWMDYVVQSYNESAQEIVADSSWLFFAIQFPKKKSSLMVIKVETEKAGDLSVATLFKRSRDKTKNGALKPKFSWDMDKISIEPDLDSLWTSPVTGEKYYMKYNISLEADKYNSELTLTTVRDNMEIVEGDTIKYEGSAIVEGTWQSKKINGIAWVELQPAGHL